MMRSAIRCEVTARADPVAIACAQAETPKHEICTQTQKQSEPQYDLWHINEPPFLIFS